MSSSVTEWGAPHYGQVRESDAYRDLDIGSIAELGAGTQRRRAVTEQIAAVAKANDGVYSPELHDAYLRTVQPDSTDREIASNVRSATSRLSFVAGFEGAGVRASEDGAYAVDADAFTQFSQRTSQRTDVRVIAEHSLAEQVEAHAVTWLDRQAFGQRPDERTADNPTVQEAVQQRREWLVQNGYAQCSGDEKNVDLLPGAMENLAAEERTDVAERLAAKYGLPVNELPRGGTVSGEYHGTEHLHAGKLAVVVTEESVFVSPIRNDPDVGAGSEVTLQRTSAQDATVEVAAGQTLDLDAGLSLDGPGGENERPTTHHCVSDRVAGRADRGDSMGRLPAGLSSRFWAACGSADTLFIRRGRSSPGPATLATTSPRPSMRDMPSSAAHSFWPRSCCLERADCAATFPCARSAKTGGPPSAT